MLLDSSLRICYEKFSPLINCMKELTNAERWT